MRRRTFMQGLLGLPAAIAGFSIKESGYSLTTERDEKLKALVIKVRVTDELLANDAFDIESEIAADLAEAFAVARGTGPETRREFEPGVRDET